MDGEDGGGHEETHSLPQPRPPPPVGIRPLPCRAVKAGPDGVGGGARGGRGRCGVIQGTNQQWGRFRRRSCGYEGSSPAREILVEDPYRLEPRIPLFKDRLQGNEETKGFLRVGSKV